MRNTDWSATPDEWSCYANLPKNTLKFVNLGKFQ